MQGWQRPPGWVPYGSGIPQLVPWEVQQPLPGYGQPPGFVHPPPAYPPNAQRWPPPHQQLHGNANQGGYQHQGMPPPGYHNSQQGRLPHAYGAPSHQGYHQGPPQRSYQDTVAHRSQPYPTERQSGHVLNGYQTHQQQQRHQYSDRSMQQEPALGRSSSGTKRKHDGDDEGRAMQRQKSEGTAGAATGSANTGKPQASPSAAVKPQTPAEQPQQQQADHAQPSTVKEYAAAERKRLKRQRKRQRDRQNRLGEQGQDAAPNGTQEGEQAAGGAGDSLDAPVLVTYGAGSDSDTESQDLVGPADKGGGPGPEITAPRAKRRAEQVVQPLIRQDVRDRPALEILYNSDAFAWAHQHAVQKQAHAVQQQGQATAFFTRLTSNIAATVEALLPSPADVHEKELAVQAVRSVVLKRFGRGTEVYAFGSHSSGLATKTSDVDLVVTGIMEPGPQGFYEAHERGEVSKVLDKILICLQRCPDLVLKNRMVVRHARVPIARISVSLKGRPAMDLHTAFPDASLHSLALDISVANMSGPQAASFIAKQVVAYPALQPLVMVLKALLKVHGLNDVAIGGISSYTLTQTVLAHLMEQQEEGQDLQDLGMLLYTYLKRFGEKFRLERDAVSVKDGGVAPRELVHNTRLASITKLICIDPLTGRSIAEGSHRIFTVLSVFKYAARAMDEILQNWKQSPSSLPRDILAHLLDRRRFS